MTDNNTRTMALAAASVLGLSLGMIGQTADADQLKHQTSTQHKGETTQIKGPSNQDKHITGQGSNQIKWTGQSNQHKVATPSPELNPQPEPPKPTGQDKPK